MVSLSCHQQMLKKKIGTYLFECCNRKEFVHLPIVFRQRSNVADLEEFPPYLGSLPWHFRWYLRVRPQGWWFYRLKSLRKSAFWKSLWERSQLQTDSKQQLAKKERGNGNVLARILKMEQILSPKQILVQIFEILAHQRDVSIENLYILRYWLVRIHFTIKDKKR